MGLGIVRKLLPKSCWQVVDLRPAWSRYKEQWGHCAEHQNQWFEEQDLLRDAQTHEWIFLEVKYTN